MPLGFLAVIIAFVVVAFVAGFLGFGLLAGVAGLIAKVLFFIFLVLVLVWIVRYFMSGRRHSF